MSAFTCEATPKPVRSSRPGGQSPHIYVPNFCSLSIVPCVAHFIFLFATQLFIEPFQGSERHFAFYLSGFHPELLIFNPYRGLSKPVFIFSLNSAGLSENYRQSTPTHHSLFTTH
jgi:hypothetical protein